MGIPSAEEKRAALAAVLGSEVLARSEQLRAFLSYVCEEEIEGRGGELTEYWIGIHALGRPPDYSPLEDSSVRTRAYELRQRLQRYYESENPEAPLRIELPKGSYAPRFISGKGTEPAEPGDGAAGLKPPFEPPRKTAFLRGWWGGLLIGVLLVSSVGVAWNRWQFRSSLEPAIRKSWAPIIKTNREVLIVVATQLQLQVTPYLAFTKVGTPKYPAPDELYPLFSEFRDLPVGAKLQMTPVQKTTNMGSTEALVKVVRTLDLLGSANRVLPETNAPLRAIRNQGAVLFGSPWYSRAAGTLLERTPWTIQLDQATGTLGLVGRGRMTGKNYLPRFGSRREYREVFGLLSVLPNDEVETGAHTIAVFSGLTSVGLHGAAAFFTSEESMRDLSARFRREGLTAWPRAYQVVVRCRASEDTELLSYAYEAHEVIVK